MTIIRGAAVLLASAITLAACGDDETVDSKVCADIDEITEVMGEASFDQFETWFADTFDGRQVDDEALADAVTWMIDEMNKPGADVFGHAWAAADERCDELGLS